MVNANNGILQFGLETEYATEAVPNKQVKISSADLNWSGEKKEEGLLTGGKAIGKTFTLSVKTDFSLSTTVRPDEVLYWLYLALGKQASPVKIGASDAWTHVLTSDNELPSATFILDRVASTYAYTGIKVDTLSFSAQPGDYLKIDLSGNGREEEVSELVAGLSPSPLMPLKFANASIKLAGEVLADVTSIKFNWKNSLDVSLQTTSTGKYFKEYFPGAREITTELELVYTSESEELRDIFKSDGDLSLEINFTSDQMVDDDIPYSVKIVVPHNQITDAKAPALSGKETIKQNITLSGFEEGTDELITVTVVNGFSGEL